MSNWCVTEFMFYADTEEGKHQLADFAKRLDYAVHNPKSSKELQGFGDFWLGNVLLEFCPDCAKFDGDVFICKYKDKDIECRGSISYISQSGDSISGDTLDTLYMSTETAWVPMPDMWNVIFLTCNYTDIKYVFQAEEPNDDVFINTDVEKRFFTTYGMADVDFSLPGYLPGTRYFDSEQEMLDEFNQIITALHDTYKDNPKKYELPAQFDVESLVPQASIADAGKLIQDNLYEVKGGTPEYPSLSYGIYETTWVTNL